MSRKRRATAADTHEWSLPTQFRASIDPQEFRFCFNLGHAAASKAMPMVSPECKPIHLEDKDGEITTVVMRDLPMTRAIFAISEHVKSCAKTGEDTLPKQMSIQFRITAVVKVMEHPLAKPWCRASAGGGIEFHEAVMGAAATADLEADGEFKPESFFQVVERIAGEKYNHEWA